MGEARQPLLIERLLQADVYPHPVSGLRLIETHISWVVLTGCFAYKLKKPLDLGFLDFSSLEKRKDACEEELRLNARLAPGLYVAVIPITGTPDRPELDGAGSAIEYAVKMHEFPQENELDRIVQSAEPDPAQLDARFREFGTQLAEFHMGLPAAAADTPYGEPAGIARDALDNFAALTAFADVPAFAALAGALRSWTEQSLTELAELLTARKAIGLVREGHGDLHLRNLVLHDDRIVPFDCIEFSPGLRWVDVINDVAFLFMDLIHHERKRFAYTFLNAWLAVSGDYAGLRLAPFYSVYRAMVRAKIAGIELLQHGWQATTDNPELQERFTKLCRHLELASQLAQPGHPLIIITHGVSGSGKTWVASRLASAMGAIHVRSDVERKRLFGMTADARSSADEKPGLYGRAASQQTYERLLNVAQTVVKAGFPVLVDATFLAPRYRDQFARLADDQRLPFVILDCQASAETLRARVAKRSRQGKDASEADAEVLDRQLASDWQLAPAELAHAEVLQTDEEIDLEALVDRITSHAARAPEAGSPGPASKT